MIEQIEVRGFRGAERKIDLGPKTIITGRNGCGKTSMVAGAGFACFGLVPGYKKQDAFLNATEGEMFAAITVNGHRVERTLRQGKTLSETVSVDTIEAKRDAAPALLRLALGAEPPIMNMPDFFSSTSSQQRAAILGLTASAEDLKALKTKETVARERLNEHRAERRRAEQVVARLVARISADPDKVVGDSSIMRVELEKVEKRIDELRDAIRTGEANEKASAHLDGLRNELPAMREKLEAAQTQQAAAVKRLESLGLELLALGEKPGLRVGSEECMRLYEVCQGLKQDIAEIKSVVPSATVTFLPQKVYDVLVRVRCDVAEMTPDVPGEHELREHALRLLDQVLQVEVREGLKTFEARMMELADAQKDAIEAYEQKENEEIAAWAIVEKDYSAKANPIHSSIEKETDLIAGLQDVSRELEMRITANEKAISCQREITEGVPENARVELAGAETLAKELREKIQSLTETEAVKREVAAAELELQKLADTEEGLKADVQDIVDQQSAVIQGASDLFAKRSKDILPYGNLRMTDDGSEVSIVWAMTPERRVHRNTLSGGEQALFDVAVGHALAPTATVVIEGAELDNNRIVGAMTHMEALETQIVILTCHMPDVIPEGWTHIDMDAISVE